MIHRVPPVMPGADRQAKRPQHTITHTKGKSATQSFYDILKETINHETTNEPNRKI